MGDLGGRQGSVPTPPKRMAIIIQPTYNSFATPHLSPPHPGICHRHRLAYTTTAPWWCVQQAATLIYRVVEGGPDDIHWSCTLIFHLKTLRLTKVCCVVRILRHCPAAGSESTGLAMMCLRKLQTYSVEYYLSEFDRFRRWVHAVYVCSLMWCYCRGAPPTHRHTDTHAHAPTHPRTRTHAFVSTTGDCQHDVVVVHGVAARCCVLHRISTAMTTAPPQCDPLKTNGT